MRKTFLAVLVLLSLGTFASAQSTTVSATITDAGGQTWNNGTYSFTFQPAASNPTAQYFWNGAPFSSTQTFSGVLSTTGTFTTSIPSSTSITPSGSAWITQVCPQATAPCYQIALTITGGTQDISAQVIPPAVQVNMQAPPSGASAYSDSEITGAKVGSVYWNLTDSTQHGCGFPVCNWISIGGSASILALNNAFTGSNTFTLPIIGSITGNAVTANTATNLNGPGTVSGVYTHIGGETFTNTVVATNFDSTIYVDGSKYATVQAALNALPAGGGTILIPPGSFACPTSVPNGAVLIGLGANPVVGVANNATILSCPAGLTLTNAIGTRWENLFFDFTTTTTVGGVGLTLSAFTNSGNAFCTRNTFRNVVLNQAGGSIVAGLTLSASGSGSFVGNTFNVFDNVVISGNALVSGSNQGPALADLLLSGSGTPNSGPSVTQNRFFNLFVRGGFVGGIDFERNTDTNYFWGVAALQEWGSTPANSYVLAFNLNTPASDVDADSEMLYGINFTSAFTNLIRLGQTSGSVVDFESTILGFGTVAVQGGTPQFSGRLLGLNGIPSTEYQDVGGNFMAKDLQVAFGSLGTPSNGTTYYCPDCTIANPCAGSGTGALAKRLNGVWVCN